MGSIVLPDFFLKGGDWQARYLPPGSAARVGNVPVLAMGRDVSLSLPAAPSPQVGFFPLAPAALCSWRAQASPTNLNHIGVCKYFPSAMPAMYSVYF